MIEAADLQELWDRYLLNKWFYDFYHYTEKGFGMARIAMDYKNLTGVYDLSELRRVPKKPHHYKMNVSRFVCGYLPRLAKVLIEGDKKVDDIPDLVEKLKRWTIDTLDSDSIANKESMERSLRAREYRAARLAVMGEIENKEKCSQFFSAHRVKTRGGKLR